MSELPQQYKLTFEARPSFVTAEFQEMIVGIKIAFVNHLLTSEDAFNFAITLGTNRSARYNVFNDNTDADVWLLRP